MVVERRRDEMELRVVWESWMRCLRVDNVVGRSGGGGDTVPVVDEGGWWYWGWTKLGLGLVGRKVNED